MIDVFLKDARVSSHFLIRKSFSRRPSWKRRTKSESAWGGLCWERPEPQQQVDVLGQKVPVLKTKDPQGKGKC